MAPNNQSLTSLGTASGYSGSVKSRGTAPVVIGTVANLELQGSVLSTADDPLEAHIRLVPSFVPEWRRRG
jgi:hypothetical protein